MDLKKIYSLLFCFILLLLNIFFLIINQIDDNFNKLEKLKGSTVEATPIFGERYGHKVYTRDMSQVVSVNNSDNYLELHLEKVIK
jgi:hypothetical protein